MHIAAAALALLTTCDIGEVETNFEPKSAPSESTKDAMRSHPQQWPQRFDKAHEAVGQFLGVADPEQLLLTPGCTSSLATAIASVDLCAASRVLTSQWEHHAVSGPLQKLTEKRVTVDSILVGDDSPVDLVEFERSLVRRDVGLVVVTAACNVTGTCCQSNRSSNCRTNTTRWF